MQSSENFLPRTTSACLRVPCGRLVERIITWKTLAALSQYSWMGDTKNESHEHSVVLQRMWVPFQSQEVDMFITIGSAESL